MSFAAREEIGSVPDCAAHLKANSEFVFIFFFFKKDVLQLFFILFKYYRRHCNYCRKVVACLSKVFPQLLNRSLPKSLWMLITQPKPEKFFVRTYSRNGGHGCDIRLKRQEMKVFRCVLRAKDVNITRNVVLVLPCFCSFNLYNFVRKVKFFCTFG